MKIAIFHELAPGGALRCVEAFGRELSKTHEVEYFGTLRVADSRKGIFNRLRHDFVDFIFLAYSHYILARKIDSANFDLVLVHPSQFTQAPFLLSFLKTRTVYYCQEPLRIAYDKFFESELTTLSPFNLLYEKINRGWRKHVDYFNVSHASQILCNSKFSQKNIESAYGRKADICYLGVDNKLFRPMRSAKRQDVLFIGAPVPIEGYDLLKAAAGHSTRKWTTEIVKRNSRGKGISDKELVKKINQSRIVVCLAHNEPFGLIPIEAMACGIPVIAVDEGGYRESIVQGETGYLVERSPINLAAAINRLLENPPTRERMGKAGLKQVQDHWTWTKSGARLASLIT